MSRFWNFVKNEANPNEVELRIDGKIVDDDQSWLYEYFGIKHSSPNKFRQELAEHAGKKLIVWVNSNGGSCAAAAGIYDAIKNHQGEKVCKITRARSAATVLAMACDEIWMSPVGDFMIHNPWTGVEGEANKLRKVASVLDVIKETIMNAYQAKTGKPREKIAQMMDAETWMSAQMAKSEGFVDKILYADDPQDAQNSFLFTRESMLHDSIADIMNFAEQHGDEDSSKQPNSDAKDSILSEAKKLLTAAWQSISSQAKNEKEEGFTLDIKNADDLKKQFPEFSAQIEAEAVSKEAARISALDALADAKNPAVMEMIAEAKASGKTADEIKASVEIMKKHGVGSVKNDAANQFVAALKDNAASGANGVGTDAPGGADAEAEMAISAMVNTINHITNGGKK